MNYIQIAILTAGLLCYQNMQGQQIVKDLLDTIPPKKVIKTSVDGGQMYTFRGGSAFVYPKPKHFAFITNLPKDAIGLVKAPFQKNAWKPTLWVAAATGALLLVDQPIIDGVRKFSDNIGLAPQNRMEDLWKIKAGNTDVKIIRVPQNINTALYQLGQGFPGLLIGGGLYVFGKINNNYRDISTASQLAESFILMGLSTQVIKRITGRETPSGATVRGGKWRPFPSFSNYQKNTPMYDAFPSGHIATMMSVVTILADNYPEKRYIRPVGYSLMGLVGFAMLNNQVHWASDYPLAIALGYVCAKQVEKRNRKELESTRFKKRRAELDYRLSYVNGQVLPGIVLKF